MKLNNKGFAISIIIYSVGSLAVLTLILILAIDSGIRKNNTAIVDAIKDELNSASKSRWTFTYSGTPEAFTVPSTGKYKLEVWGASGGTLGGTAGNGGYATGTVALTYNSKLYIVVGGTGEHYDGGYNGGGDGGIATGSEGTQSGAGGGGDDGQRGIDQRLHLAGGGAHIVPQIAGLKGVHGHGLGRVHHRTTAQGHHKVAVVVPGEAAALLHNSLEGIRHNFVKQKGLNACHAELFQGAVQSAAGLGGLTVGNATMAFLPGMVCSCR